MPLMNIDFYILVDGLDVKKVKGKPFKLGEPPITFYYQNIKDDGGKNRFVITIPDSGIKLCTGRKLKDCKEYILNNFDFIKNEMNSDEYKKLRDEFQRLKEIKIEQEKSQQ